MESMALGLRNILSQNLKTDRLHLKSEKWKWKACDTIERKKNILSRKTVKTGQKHL